MGFIENEVKFNCGLKLGTGWEPSGGIGCDEDGFGLF